MAIYCPVPGAQFDCPECDKYGFCKLDNPKAECDDYYAYTGDEEE